MIVRAAHGEADGEAVGESLISLGSFIIQVVDDFLAWLGHRLWRGSCCRDNGSRRINHSLGCYGHGKLFLVGAGGLCWTIF